VLEAVENLRAVKPTKTGRALPVFFALKRMGLSTTGWTNSNGPAFADFGEYYRIPNPPDAGRPFFDAVADLWRHDNWPRGDLLTLYKDRTALVRSGKLKVESVGDDWRWRLEDGYEEVLKQYVRAASKIPLTHFAAWLFRGVTFPASASVDDVRGQLRAELNLTDAELDVLFELDGDGTAAFFTEEDWDVADLTSRLPSPTPDLHGEGAEIEDETLEDLVEVWKRETGYPSEHDQKHIAARRELAELLAEDVLLQAADDPSTVDASAFNRLAGGAYGSPGNQSVFNRFLRRGDEAVQRTARTLHHLLYGPGDDVDRLDEVLELAERKVPGLAEGVATKALAVLNPDVWIPLYVYDSANGKKAAMQLPELGLTGLDEAGKSVGRLAKEANDRLRERLEPALPGDPWGQMAFLWWLLKRQKSTVPDWDRPSDIEDLAAELQLDAAWLRRVVALLRDKRQIILYGPPGTGKTYVARRLAQFLAPDPGNRRTVQFHPSFAYEDFVEGYRPLKGAGGDSVVYEVRPGPLRSLAEHAQQTSEPCVLVIDEINRGNIAKVFGELYYLLEYRNDDVRLQYSPDDPFSLPDNLYLIGTMNTADRSIAILDGALRRRFHFFEFYPDRPPVEGLLRRWLRHSGLDAMAYVADIVDLANEKLPDRHMQIGPSHFMRPDLDREKVELIWDHSVIPFIADQFYDEADRVSEFALAKLEQELGITAAAVPPGSVKPDANEGGDSAASSDTEGDQA
jgi:MoxR-like ATPase